MKLYDAIVIGGGPVGSYVAYKLAEMGYGVVVLEQKERLGKRVCCTGIIGRECVSSFAVDDNVILGRVNSAKLFPPSGRWLKLWRRETQAYIIDRVAFDVAMASRAQHAGAEYRLNSLVSNIEVRDDRVRIEIAHQGLNLEARVVIIATGFGSPLRERLGLGKVSDFVIGAQAEVKTIRVNEVEVYFGQEIAPGFFAWLVPTSPQTARVGLLSRRSPDLYLKKLMSLLLAQGKIVSTEVELSYGGIQLKSLAKTYGERLIVVGGAAGQVKPTTGGGIYYGLLCADIAANKLHQALESDDLSARSLASYEREWKQKLGRELRIGYWARKLYERLSDQQINWIFDIIKSNGIDEALLKADDLSFDWHGEAILRLIGHKAVAKAIAVTKLPFLKG
ncbi:NAD(P)/FAD-dependent oxidoreductase, partial [Dehalococcoidales bacterium]|nr:NAD(P)/FAD-dependent oxidoreductase [Dehalococcoidales bacterium]